MLVIQWKREGVEYRGGTKYEDGHKKQLSLGWCIYKDAGGWTIGLLLSARGRLTGKHIAVGWAESLLAAKSLAESAAQQLYHDAQS